MIFFYDKFHPPVWIFLPKNRAGLSPPVPRRKKAPPAKTDGAHAQNRIFCFSPLCGKTGGVREAPVVTPSRWRPFPPAGRAYTAVKMR